MRVAIGSDHAGFALKGQLCTLLDELRVEYRDFGTFSDAPVDYPDVIAPVARAVARGEFERGIVLGGSGTGEAIVANKVRGIRCVEAADPVTAERATRRGIRPARASSRSSMRSMEPTTPPSRTLPTTMMTGTPSPTASTNAGLLTSKAESMATTSVMRPRQSVTTVRSRSVRR